MIVDEPVELAPSAPPTPDQSAASGEQSPPQAEQSPSDDASKEGQGDDQKKPEKSQEQREIDRLRQALDRRTLQLAKARAKYGLTPPAVENNNPVQTSDSEVLTLTRAERDRLIQEEARKLAPTIASQQQQEEAFRKAAYSLKESLGDQFEELTNDLAEIFDAPRQRALMQVEDPASVVRFLTDPLNEAEAEAIGKMDLVHAGIALARIEARIKSERQQAKPKPSSAPKPLEDVRSTARTNNGAPDPANVKAWTRWANAQEAKSR